MKNSIFVVVILIVTACIPRHPVNTTRPDLDDGPWEERHVTSGDTGQQFRYLFLAGPSKEAPAILLLPGGIFDNRIWLYTAELRSHFNVYALDWPHDSAMYHGDVNDFGDVAHDFLVALELRELYVAGISAGAYAAIDLVSTKKDLDVRGLFIYSAVMFAISKEEVKKRTRMSKFALGMKPERLRSFIEWKVSRTKFAESPGKIRQKDIFYVRPYSYYSQLFGMTFNQGDQPQATGEIDCPVLVLQGTDDDIMPVELAKETPGVFGDAKFMSFDGLGHAMVFSDGPQLVKVMVDFLKERDLLPLVK